MPQVECHWYASQCYHCMTIRTHNPLVLFISTAHSDVSFSGKSVQLLLRIANVVKINLVITDNQSSCLTSFFSSFSMDVKMVMSQLREKMVTDIQQAQTGKITFWPCGRGDRQVANNDLREGRGSTSGWMGMCSSTAQSHQVWEAWSSLGRG